MPPRGFLIRTSTAVVLLSLTVIAARRCEHRESLTEATTVSTPRCNLSRQTCRFQLSTGQGNSLSATPIPTPAGRPIAFTLQSQANEFNSANIEFEGVEMNMGVFRQALSSSGTDQFAGSLVLPLCVTGPMRWRVRLLVNGREGLREIEFQLETTSSP